MSGSGSQDAYNRPSLLCGRRPRVLLSAYACEPGTGSEPGIGWNWVRQISRFCDVHVITRKNNREAIERELQRERMFNTHFHYFDLPGWMSFWKIKNRGVQAYYYLWQVGVYPLMKQLQRQQVFDLVHHLTFGTCWFPSFGAFLPARFVWGTVGGGETSPWTFWPSFSARGIVHELVRSLGRTRGVCDPMVRWTARNADVALAATPETAARLSRMGCKDVRVIPHAALNVDEIAKLALIPFRTGSTIRIFSVGRLLHWKGFHLALEAFAVFHSRFRDSEYWLFGDGPERARLERQAVALGLADNLRFFKTITRAELLKRIAECDLMIHPTLHDSSGWASVEAMACGRPVVCLDMGGPALQVDESVGRKVRAANPEEAIVGLANALMELAHDHSLRVSLGAAGRRRVREQLNWDVRGQELMRVYSELLGDVQPVELNPNCQSIPDKADRALRNALIDAPSIRKATL